MVGVLSDDDHFHFVEWTKVKGGKYLFSGRITGALAVFVADEFRERLEIRLFEFVCKDLSPRCFNLYHMNVLK